ncbi:DUF6804 family protein [Thermonema lapsum]|uniref:DUF6804 family protein n=1 Tax=Thermonema lapsum TaxID=28195 RepID=UPI00374446AB
MDSILSILLLLCLADMPCGYFQFARFISLIGFAVLAYQANEQKKYKPIRSFRPYRF